MQIIHRILSAGGERFPAGGTFRGNVIRIGPQGIRREPSTVPTPVPALGTQPTPTRWPALGTLPAINTRAGTVSVLYCYTRTHIVHKVYMY